MQEIPITRNNAKLHLAGNNIKKKNKQEQYKNTSYRALYKTYQLQETMQKYNK